MNPWSREHQHFFGCPPVGAMGVNVAPGLGLTFIKLDDPVKMPLVEKEGWHLHHDQVHFHFPHISVLFSSAATVCQLNWLAGLIACQSTRWKKLHQMQRITILCHQNELQLAYLCTSHPIGHY